MSKKLNAAIIILVSRKKVFYKTLQLFFTNWNNKFRYPIHIHTFENIFNEAEIENLQKKYKTIFFHHIKSAIPGNIKFEDLFFNRFYNNFAFKSFNPFRLNYLHMCNFTSNISSFGKIGCLDNKLKKYDYLMRIDDDSWFKKKIKKDLFISLKKFPMASGRLTITKSSKIHLTREKLFQFIKRYVKKNKILVKNKQLKKILSQNNERMMNNLQFSLGNFDLYNMKEFKSNRFKKYINAVNDYGGIYKYRWADYDLLNIYLYMFYSKPLFDFKFNEEIYSSRHPDSYKIRNYQSLLKLKNKDLFNVITFFIKKMIFKLKYNYFTNELK